jgi:hypothetical protein
MSDIEVSQLKNKILITFETEHEAELAAPAFHAITQKLSSDESLTKRKFISLVFSNPKQIEDSLGLDEAFELAKKRAVYIKDFYYDYRK